MKMMGQILKKKISRYKTTKTCFMYRSSNELSRKSTDIILYSRVSQRSKM